MKRPIFLLIVITFGLLLSCSSRRDLIRLVHVANYSEFFFEVVMDSTISDSTPAKVVNLKGFKEFALLSRFEGQANETFDFEIGFNRLTVVRETIELNAQGWANFAKLYPVYAPNVGVCIYHPPPNTKVKMMIYAGH